MTIKLSRDQAFVLSHWFFEVERSGELDGIVNDRAVWSPLHAISGTLETTLAEIFMPDYDVRLEAARVRLIEAKYGGRDE
ncbi:hypothetical protein K7862_00595 [Streptomyces sp. PLK6-54]|uniref:Uncharacterized protein n=1 Tax=Actinacidiphila acidipaludis TaxID=2873382 RepID=A0ABS7PZ69_9ACTN|nr:hypothetical protein [Streptomyces acidipaludis]